MLEHSAETLQPTMLLGLALFVFLGEEKFYYKYTDHDLVFMFLDSLLKRVFLS